MLLNIWDRDHNLYQIENRKAGQAYIDHLYQQQKLVIN